MILATKVGSVIPRDGRDISPGHIEKAVEASLRRLQTDYIDVYQLHSPQLHHLQENNWLEAMQSLKEQGKIRYWGASVNHIDAGVWLLEQDLIDSLQPTFHMLYHDMADAMFGLATERDVGVVVKQGLARGLLSGKYAADHAFTGSGWHEQGAVVAHQVILQKVEELRFLERAGRSQAQAALQYLLSYPVVSTIIAGAKRVEQLEMNAGSVQWNRTGGGGTGTGEGRFGTNLTCSCPHIAIRLLGQGILRRLLRLGKPSRAGAANANRSGTDTRKPRIGSCFPRRPGP